MIARLRALITRRKRLRQIRELEDCLLVLRPELTRIRCERAVSLDDVLSRLDTIVTVSKAERALAHLRESV